MYTIGMKYQIFENGERKVRRLLKYKNNKNTNDNITCTLVSDNEDDIIISSKELNEKYVSIIPDAFLNIMITKEPDFNGTEINDVYFCISKSSDLSSKNYVPSLILRQNCYSKFKNTLNIYGNIYIGECATVVNSSKEELIEMMQWEEIKKKYSVALYIDDSEDTILRYISNKIKKDINNVLVSIKKSMGDNIKGAAETIEELFKDNDFIGNYKSIFNIAQIDFPIVLGKESYNNNGDIIINSKQKNRLEDMLKRYIDNIRIIKYDKDIDISKIINVQHVVVSDSDNIIYLIAYDVVGYYAKSEDDMQIINSMM